MNNKIIPPEIFLCDTGTIMGRGVFANRFFSKGDVVEVVCVLIIKMNYDDLPQLLHNYVFNWSALTGGEANQHALALGYGSMYNHNNPANLRYEADEHAKSITFIADCEIKEGEELTINYNAGGGFSRSDSDNWFDDRDLKPFQRIAATLNADKSDIRLLDHDAVEWAATQIAECDVSLCSNNPWATVYFLKTIAQASYLKIFPPNNRAALQRNLIVANNFLNNTPRVIGFSREHDCILFEDHCGRDLKNNNDYIEVARKFGAIQVQAWRSSDIFCELDTVDLTGALQAFMAFLAAPSASNSENSSGVGVAYFIGQEKSKRYEQFFKSRLHLFEYYLNAAASLPLTLCHGDLQARNLAIKNEDQVIFYDWDDAALGPAGLCLHGLFSGCTLPAILLNRWIESGTAGDSAYAKRLQAYVDVLTNAGYCEKSTLLPALIGSICAGQMRFLTCFGIFPNEEHKADCAKTLCALLSDLLDFFDYLSTINPGAAIAAAKEYEKFGEWHRAERLVQDILARDENNIDALVHYSLIAYQLGELDAAEKYANMACLLSPSSTDVHIAKARTFLGRLDLAACTAMLTPITGDDSENAISKEIENRCHTIISARKSASEAKILPRVLLTDQELDLCRLQPDTQSLIVEFFKEYGVVQIDNLFSLDLISDLQREFYGKYGESTHESGAADSLCVGDKRHMLTMELDQVFGTDELIASKKILPFVQRILGEDFILSAFTAVVSYPGSADQIIHKDHSPLFPENGWGFTLPTFALQIVIPLLQLNQATGFTRVFKSSQLLENPEASLTPYQDSLIPLGSCLLLDYSVAHYGTGNNSNNMRPILNLVYSRPWFRDYQNYQIQPPLKFSQKYYDHASETIRKLVGWSMFDW